MTNKFLLSLSVLVSGHILLGQTIWLQGELSSYSKNNQPAKVYLLKSAMLKSFEIIDSAILGNDGSFRFKTAKEIQPQLYQVNMTDGTPISFLSKSTDKIKVSGTATGFFYGEAEINGSIEYEVYSQLERIEKQNDLTKTKLGEAYDKVPFFDPKFTAKTDAIHAQLVQDLTAANNEIKILQNKHQGTFAADVLAGCYYNALKNESHYTDTLYDNPLAFQHEHFFDHINLTDFSIAQFPIFYKRLDEYMAEYINGSNLDGFKEGVDKVMSKIKNEELKAIVAVYLSNGFKEQNRHDMTDYVLQTYYNTGCEVVNTSNLKAVVASLKAASLGSIAPEISLPDINGNELNLSKARNKKAVIIYFWSSHCQYCLNSLPELMAFYSEKSLAGLEVYAVSLDNSRELWANFTKANHLQWMNVCEGVGTNSKTANIYGVRGTPTYILLDQNMKITNRTHDLHELIAKALELL